MNTKLIWKTTVTIMDPERAALWGSIFPGAKMPIVSMMPRPVEVPERGYQYAYMLDLDAISDEQRQAVIELISKRFSIPVQEVIDELPKGSPILCENTIAESTDPGLLFAYDGSGYPPPDLNPNCRCKHNPMAQMFCMTGHMTECHYPLGCADAGCSHHRAASEDYFPEDDCS